MKKILTLLFLIIATFITSGCAPKQPEPIITLVPQQQNSCPKLPIYKNPPIKKITSLKRINKNTYTISKTDFDSCIKTVRILRATNNKYKKVNILINKKYHKPKAKR